MSGLTPEQDADMMRRHEAAVCRGFAADLADRLADPYRTESPRELRLLLDWADAQYKLLFVYPERNRQTLRELRAAQPSAPPAERR